MLGKSFLKFGDIAGVRVRVGDCEVIFPSVGDRLLHFGFILLIPLDVLRFYRFGV